MIRNFIVGAFEAFAWFFFAGVIAYGTWYGYDLADKGMLRAGMMMAEPWQGAVAGFIGGIIAAIVVTGTIFTLLDIRAGTDRITWLMERELRNKYGDDRDSD